MLLNYKKLGDNFTLDEYNAIVYLLKNKITKVSENIQLTNEGFHGKFGEYFFEYNPEQVSMKPDSIIIIDNAGEVTLKIKSEFIGTFSTIVNNNVFSEIIENNERVIKISLADIPNDTEISNIFTMNIDYSGNEISRFIDTNLILNFEDLETAIINANEGDVITLESTLTNPLNHSISINKKISIKGSVANSLLDDSSHISTSGLFNITSTGELTLENITIKGYTNTSNGGAININNGTLNCLNCKFENCNSNTKGGAINNLKGELYLTNTEFKNCTAPNGGAIYNGEV